MLGAEFKEWRTKLGFTQEDVAHRFRISRVTVINWENGNSPISQIVEQLCMSYHEEWEREQRRRLEYGPVALLCAGGYGAAGPYHNEPFPNNAAALDRAAELWETLKPGKPMIKDEANQTTWDCDELCEEIERRCTSKKKEVTDLIARMNEIADHFSSLPVLDDRTDDEILGYDERGLPR